MNLRELMPEEAARALGLWTSIPELEISAAFDTEERIVRFLQRNPGLSAAAFEEERMVGALLCGQDGRRGFFYHLGVLPDYRGQGIARRLVQHSLTALRQQNIDSCFLFAYDRNTAAQHFWRSLGFEYAPHVMYHSKKID